MADTEKPTEVPAEEAPAAEVSPVENANINKEALMAALTKRQNKEDLEGTFKYTKLAKIFHTIGLGITIGMCVTSQLGMGLWQAEYISSTMDPLASTDRVETVMTCLRDGCDLKWADGFEWKYEPKTQITKEDGDYYPESCDQDVESRKKCAEKGSEETDYLRPADKYSGAAYYWSLAMHSRLTMAFILATAVAALVAAVCWLDMKLLWPLHLFITLCWSGWWYIALSYYLDTYYARMGEGGEMDSMKTGPGWGPRAFHIIGPIFAIIPHGCCTALFLWAYIKELEFPYMFSSMKWFDAAGRGIHACIAGAPWYSTVLLMNFTCGVCNYGGMHWPAPLYSLYFRMWAVPTAVCTDGVMTSDMGMMFPKWDAEDCYKVMSDNRGAEVQAVGPMGDDGQHNDATAWRLFNVVHFWMNFLSRGYGWCQLAVTVMLVVLLALRTPLSARAPIHLMLGAQHMFGAMCQMFDTWEKDAGAFPSSAMPMFWIALMLAQGVAHIAVGGWGIYCALWEMGRIGPKPEPAEPKFDSLGPKEANAQLDSPPQSTQAQV